jgi:hypothetical protein
MMTPTSKRLPAYASIAATDDVKEKLEIWRLTLSKRWGRRATYSETIDYLLDNIGVPPEEDGDDDNEVRPDGPDRGDFGGLIGQGPY